MPFLRLYLAVDSSNDHTTCVRVVAYGDTALLTRPYLQVAPKILVQARHRQRRRHDRDEKVHEFVADHIVFMEKTDWEQGTPHGRS